MTIESNADQVVVVDANCIVRGAWFLDSAAWHVLLYQSRMGLKQVVVPEVVVREVVGRFAEDLRVSKDRAADAGRTLDSFLRWSGELPRGADTDELDEEECVCSYETGLRRVLAEASVTVPPMPQVDVDDFVHRAIYRLRPFNEAGSGFRDCLLWKSFQLVVEAQPDIPAVLISADHKAFWDSGNIDLHPDLVIELESRGLASSVTLYESVADYVKAQQIGDMHIVARVLRKVTETQDQLREWVSGALTGRSLTSDGILSVKALVSEVTDATVIFQSVSGVTTGGSELLLVNFLVKASTGIAWSFDASDVVEELESRIFTSATATFDLDAGAFADFNLDPPTVAGCLELSSRLDVILSSRRAAEQPFLTDYQDLLKRLAPAQDFYADLLKNFTPMQDFYADLFKNLAPAQDFYADLLKNFTPMQDFYADLLKNFTPMQDFYADLLKNLTPLIGQLESAKDDGEEPSGSEDEASSGEGEEEDGSDGIEGSEDD